MTQPVEPLIAASPVTVVSNANYSAGWTHAAGDLLILLWSSVAVPVPPAAGGTVPKWKPLTNAKLPQNLTSFGGSSMMLTAWYAWATRTGHTAGTWTNGNFGWMVALRGADKTNPFGSGSQRMDSVGGQTYPTAPGVGTMEFPGKSVVIHNFGWNHSSSLSWMTSPSASNGGMIQCTNTTGVRGNYVGYQSSPTSAGTASGQLTAGANVTSGLSIEVVPLRPGPGINVNQAGTWKRSTPKGVIVDGAWVPPQRVSVLTGGEWKEVWPLTPAAPLALRLVDAATKQSTNTMFPPHNSGDLQIVVATAIGGTTPTLPTGWNEMLASNSNNSMAVRVGWKKSDGQDLSTGTWSGSMTIATLLFEGANEIGPIGAIAQAYNSGSTTVTLNPQVGDGNGLFLYCFSTDGSFGTWGAVPEGYELLATDPKTIIFKKTDTTAGGSVTMSHGGYGKMRAVAVEILPA